MSEPAPIDRRPVGRPGAAPGRARQAGAVPDPGTPSSAAVRGFGGLVERITPWLFDVGTWVFGGLIAFNVVVISALLTVGPVDTAIKVSITAFGSALPLTVAGMCVLRLVKDMKDVGLDDLKVQAYRDAGYPDAEAYFADPQERRLQRSKRAVVALWYALGIATASIVLTVIGIVASLWYMAWWIGSSPWRSVSPVWRSSWPSSGRRSRPNRRLKRRQSAATGSRAASRTRPEIVERAAGDAGRAVTPGAAP